MGVSSEMLQIITALISGLVTYFIAKSKDKNDKETYNLEHTKTLFDQYEKMLTKLGERTQGLESKMELMQSAHEETVTKYKSTIADMEEQIDKLKHVIEELKHKNKEMLDIILEVEHKYEVMLLSGHPRLLSELKEDYGELDSKSKDKKGRK